MTAAEASLQRSDNTPPVENDEPLNRQGKLAKEMLEQHQQDPRGEPWPNVQLHLINPQREIDQLRLHNAELETQISNLEQGQDFRSKGGHTGPEHGTIQIEIATMRSHLKNWVHKTFDVFRFQNDPKAVTVENFPFEKFPEFQDRLNEICGRNVRPAQFAQMRVNILHLIEAVVADIIFKDVLLKPLNGCELLFKQEVETQLFEFMVYAHGKEARNWQASCLKSYEEQDTWPPYFNDSTERHKHRDEFCQSIRGSILNIVGRIVDTYCSRKADDGESGDDALFHVVKEASNLSVKLGMLQSGIELMDFKWFEQNHLSFSSTDHRMELRSIDEGSDSKMEGEIAIVLCPGLLKWGRDNAENWNSWSVWTRARVEVFERRRLINDEKRMFDSTIEPSGFD